MMDAASRALVQLFVLDLEAPGAGGAHDLELLDAYERSRVERLRFKRHKNHFIASHAGLRRCLSAVTGQAPDALKIVGPEHEKPQLVRRHPDKAACFFNLSHSGRIALVGVSQDGPVGVDVEVLRDLPDVDSVARQVFRDEEMAALAALPPEQKTRGFFRAWTRKEAVIKTTGEGFRADLKSFGVTLDSDQEASFLCEPGAVAGSTWGLAHASVGPGAVGAVAMLVPGEDPSFDLVVSPKHAVCSGPQS